ncbi:hypothetical protein GJ496_000461 [Pomphorhynchus laevis]|nr:hypothetical protein GJ496_000461 [Pomphorhynchus laevis]
MFEKADFDPTHVVNDIFEQSDTENDLLASIESKHQELVNRESILKHKLEYILTSKECNDLIEQTLGIWKLHQDLGKLLTFNFLNANNTIKDELQEYDNLQKQIKILENQSKLLIFARQLRHVCRLLSIYRNLPLNDKQGRKEIEEKLKHELTEDMCKVRVIKDALADIRLPFEVKTILRIR